ncbi:MAG TPA: TRAM domain-containing protein, partial [Ktedonobacterales bacterium]
FALLSVVSGIILWNVNTAQKWSLPPWLVLIIALAAGAMAVALIPYVIIEPARWIRDQIRQAEVSDLLAAAFGLVVGLLIAALLAIPLSKLDFWNLGAWLPTLGTLLFAYIGVAAAVLRKDDFGRLLSVALNARSKQRGNEQDEEEGQDASPTRGLRFSRKSKPGERVLVDTSCIIDGRIADISQTGFIPGTLLVTRFVLEELQHIADSSDSMRRTRGRRGLDVLQRLKESGAPVEISDADAEGITEVDGKLVKLARQWKCAIITNDYNLNQVANLQGVRVLNINELAHAVKPMFLPGEDMEVKVIQEGKEYGQGVGYLDDGTMIVVENGKQYLGETIEVSVTRVLQTVAGRMIFAAPRQQTTPVRRTGTA